MSRPHAGGDLVVDGAHDVHMHAVPLHYRDGQIGQRARVGGLGGALEHAADEQPPQVGEVERDSADHRSTRPGKAHGRDPIPERLPERGLEPLERLLRLRHHHARQAAADGPHDRPRQGQLSHHRADQRSLLLLEAAALGSSRPRGRAPPGPRRCGSRSAAPPVDAVLQLLPRLDMRRRLASPDRTVTSPAATSPATALSRRREILRSAGGSRRRADRPPRPRLPCARAARSRRSGRAPPGCRSRA